MRNRFLGTGFAGAVVLVQLAAACLCGGGQARAAEPLMATVRQSDGTNVHIDVGLSHGVAPGTRFRVFALGKVIRIPLTGTVTYSEGRPVGVIRVVDPGQSSASCVVESVEAGRTITPGLDAVYLSGPVSASAPRLVAPRPTLPASPAAPRGAGTLPSAPSLSPTTPAGSLPLPAPTSVSIAADPARPAPGQAVSFMLRGLEGAKAGYRVDWSSAQGSFSAEKTATASVTWIAPRRSGRHEIRAAVTLADGKMLDCRGVIHIVGEPVVRDKVDLERVMGYLTFEGRYPLRAQDVALDEEGNTYFLDWKLRCVFRLGRGARIAAAASRKACADARLSEPRALAVRAGRIYILDAARPYVKVFEGGKLALEMGSAIKMGDPMDLTVDRRGFTYVVDRARRCFHVFNAGGTYLHQRGARGREGLGQFEQPVAMDAAGNGNLFVLDRVRKDIQVFDPAYSVVAKIDVRVQRGNLLVDLAVAADGKSVHVLEGPRGIVGRYSIENKVISYPAQDEVKFPDLPPNATKMAADGLGRLYVLARTREGVFRYTADGGAAGRFAADPASKVTGIAVDDAGRLAILDRRSPHIRLYDPDGWLVERFGRATNTPTPYRLPRRIAMTRRGSMVATLGQYSGSAFDAPTEIPALHIFGTGGKAPRAVGPRGKEPGQFRDAVDIDGDREGNVYALDRDLFRISVFSGRGVGRTPERERTLTPGSRHRLPHEVHIPYRIAVDADTGDIYIYDLKTRVIKKFTRDTVYVGSTSPDLGFREVERMRVDHLGFLWVFDRRLRELRRIDFRGNLPKASLSLELGDTAADAIDFGLDATGRVYVLTSRDLVYVFR